MVAEIKKLERPIDVMFLIHKALSAEALRVEKLIEQLEPGGSLQPFRAAFNLWASALMYHADVEDQYMTAPLTNCPPARTNEAEHAELARMLAELPVLLEKDDTRGLEQRVKEAMAVLTEAQHVELMQKLEDVLAVLNGEIGKTRVIARTQRHLYGKVVALRICQDDHLENEEAFVLPEVNARMSDARQLALARRLLIDESSQDPRWIVDWVAQALTPEERTLLSTLEARFSSMPTAGEVWRPTAAS